MLVAACPLLMFAFEHGGARCFPAYRAFSKRLIAAQAALASVVPFALWDLLLLAAAIGLVAALVVRVRTRRPMLPLVSHVALLVSVALLLSVGWALNHYAPALSDELGLAVRSYSTEELATATAWYLEQAAELAPQVPRDEEGQLAPQDFFELARIGGAAYEDLGERHAIFQGSTRPVKALLLWGEPLLYSGHTGIFWAATGESGVPLNCADADKPFIMCHEAAHRLAIASEQEANFAAYLACADSDDVRFAYSGAYNAFCYCLNALVSYDPARAQQLLDEAAAADYGAGVALVWADRLAASAHYQAYQGSFQKVGSAVNDRYLKSFGEDAGVRSYGLVVDYLIAWQEAEQGGGEPLV